MHDCGSRHGAASGGARIPRPVIVVLAAGLLAAALLQQAVAHNVPTTLTDADRLVIERVLDGISIPADPMDDLSFEEQVGEIRMIQQAVFRMAPGEEGIPLGQTREPADLKHAGGGLCYDRSRSIEKFLKFAGFQTRHVSLYSITKTDSPLLSLLSPGTESHALSEVKTAEGWLLVDSLTDWLGLDQAGMPVTAEAMADALAEGRPIQFLQPPPMPLLNAPFVAVYGLYSRNGEFYPPFDRVPDVNFGELLDNL